MEKITILQGKIYNKQPFPLAILTWPEGVDLLTGSYPATMRIKAIDPGGQWIRGGPAIQGIKT